MTKDEINAVLKRHGHWIRKDCEGWKEMQAYLRFADLREADLRGANLTNADLREADLDDADLNRADFRGAKNVPPLPMACPSEGSFIAWKKAGGFIVKLRISENARRSSAAGKKCRADKAEVLAIENIDRTPAGADSVASNYDDDFVYTLGKTVSVPNFDTDRWRECAAGIHFFIDRLDAVEYAN